MDDSMSSHVKIYSIDQDLNDENLINKIQGGANKKYGRGFAKYFKN